MLTDLLSYTNASSQKKNKFMLLFSHVATRNAAIYFTTSGSKPDPFVKRDKNTIKYKGPFLLNPGKRTIKAIAVSR